MKKILSIMLLATSVSAFAWGSMEKFDISVSYTKLHTTEQAAVATGVAVENKIKAGKFKSVGNENFKCDFGSEVNYYTKNVEVKKLYVNGVAKYKTIVNAIMECEEEYDM